MSSTTLSPLPLMELASAYELGLFEQLSGSTGGGLDTMLSELAS